MRDPRPPLADGYDRIGPFHPYVVFAGVLLLNVFIIAALLTLVALVGDTIEDTLFPGGADWIREL